MRALSGLRVVELSNERSAYAGKLLGDMGADVILVEPPGGDPARNYPPFVNDQPGPDRSLWWWHYNTSKRGIVLDLENAVDRERFKSLISSADVLIESEPNDRLAKLGLDYEDLRLACENLIFVSITPFGRQSENANAPVTDLTLLAGAGPVWSCGYDDHALPPVRPGANHGYHTGCHFAVMSALTALYHRMMTGEGQFVDVSMHAASNISTEHATYCWLLAGETVQRQTGRHAAVLTPSPNAQIQCKDGRWVNVSTTPRSPAEFTAVLAWLGELGIDRKFPQTACLELGASRKTPLTLDLYYSDKQAAAMIDAGREALVFLASTVTAQDFFLGMQQRGMPVGVINSAEEAFEDEHFRARGFQVEVEHPEHGRSFRYPGAPYRFSATPWEISRRAPRLGEHDTEVLGGT
jgi:crotonobetainyl-CoA:carnitine CoA-transferase CaiB-like acyl-CoA transferase